MALSEIELKRCEKDIEVFMGRRRRPAHIRNELDVGCRVDGQSVEVFEIRPQFSDPAVKQESPIAKATFVRTTMLAKLNNFLKLPTPR